jgi:spermidine/putrescine transport system ATP-binding protein
MARVELRRICKSYPGVTALDNVELVVEPGEFFTLLGPSGCGKTTLLRTIAGFNQQDSGEILFDGAMTSRRTGATSGWCTGLRRLSAERGR